MRLTSALLWFDNRSRIPFSEKAQEASRAYEHKFGRHPDVCYVHPDDVPADASPPSGLDIRPEHGVLRHHMYVGVKPPSR